MPRTTKITNKPDYDWMKGGLFGLEGDYSNNPYVDMATNQQAQAMAVGAMSNNDANLTKARLNDINSKHAFSMLLGVTAAAGFLCGIMTLATNKTGDDIKVQVKEKLHSGQLNGELNQAQAKKIVDDANRAITKMRKQVHPWKMRIKGGAKMIMMVGAAMALIMGAYHVYIKIAEKCLEKKSEEYHDVVNKTQVVQA